MPASPRIAERDGHLFLRTAVDTKKDQTYFLWMLTEEQLKRTIFPLGDLTKDEVREIAREHGYEKLAVKRESQEICFIPNDDYRSFLRANVPDYNERVRAGEYIDKDGKVLGYHQGYVNYTIGQRKGLGIALGQPAYITHIDAATNRITLGTNEDMYASELKFRPIAQRSYSETVLQRSGLTAQRSYTIVAVLSGLEPHRTILEKEILARFGGTEKQLLIVEGLLHRPNTRIKRGNITIVPHMADGELAAALKGAKHIIARSGYSTIMDLETLGLLNSKLEEYRPEIELIPTPGQPEQEYLATWIEQKAQ